MSQSYQEDKKEKKKKMSKRLNMNVNDVTSNMDEERSYLGQKNSGFKVD